MQAAPLLVPLAEEGWTEGEVPQLVARRYLEPLVRQGIDALVLGCTHYPLLRGVFARVLGAGVKIVDSATATAREVRERLRALRIARRGAAGTQSFLVTETP